MSRLLGVGAIPLKIIPGEVKKNLENFANQVGWMKYSNPWIKLITAPELCFQGGSHMNKLAESIPGSITDLCCDLARKHKIYLIPGSIYEKDGDDIYNTAPVINPEGVIISKYRKMHPWRPLEKTKSGKETVVFEIPGIGVVGVCICYDIWFPELVRDLIREGAEVIVVPTLTGTQDRRQELILAQAAAITNQCYIVDVNALDVGGNGQSLIVDPEGNIIQLTGQLAENMIAMLDLDHVKHIRQYGTCGVSRTLASYFHENHRYRENSENREKRLKDPSLQLNNVKPGS